MYSNYYTIERKNKAKEAYLDYKKLDGFKVRPKNKVEYEGVIVNKLLVIKPSFIEKLLKRKVKRKLDLYLNYVIQIIDSDDDDTSNINGVLNDLKRYQNIVEYNYRKFLDEKYIELLLKKMALLEHELKTKLFMQQNRFFQEEEITKEPEEIHHRSR